MEYVHGEDIARIANQFATMRRGPLPLGALLRIAVDVCAGLHHAHQATDTVGRPLGIVHRDVSPQNVLATYDGQVKIIDFGIARATAVASTIPDGPMGGKHAYTSPEQVKGAPIDARSDVFSVGVMLWELATWRRLFRREAEHLTMRAVVEDPAPPLPARDDLPPAVLAELDRIVARALAKDPDARYPSADALGRELEALAVTSGADLSRDSFASLLREVFAVRLAEEEAELREAQVTNVDELLVRVDEKAPGPPGSPETSLTFRRDARPQQQSWIASIWKAIRGDGGGDK
jgi:serine/threonine-protein kinase